MKNKLLKGLSLLPIIIGLVLVNIPTNKQVNKVDNKKFAFYLNDTESDVAPSKDSGYVFEKAECKTESGNNSDVVISWDNDTWTANVSNIKSKGIKCSIYFTKPDEEQIKDTVFTITLDKNGGTGGTDGPLYQKFENGWFSDSEGNTTLSTITVPTKDNNTFGGYYTGVDGAGEQVIAANGSINSNSDKFVTNTTLYAKWTPVKKNLTVNKGTYIKSVSGGGSIACGTQVTVTATPNDPTQGDWSVTGNPTAEGQTRSRTVSTYAVSSITGVSGATKNGNSFTFTMPCSDTTVTINGSKADSTETQTSKSNDNRVYEKRESVGVLWTYNGSEKSYGKIHSLGESYDDGSFTISGKKFYSSYYETVDNKTLYRIYTESSFGTSADGNKVCVVILDNDYDFPDSGEFDYRSYETLLIEYRDAVIASQCQTTGDKIEFTVDVPKKVISGSLSYYWQ